MRYHLDTIPVWDAYRQDSECPLCDLRRKNERMYVENFLGASVMEPAVRLEVNEKGFCGRHFAQMFSQKNRLGLALMTHTHFQQATQGPLAGEPKRRKGLLAKKETPPEDARESCILCERLTQTMDRYLYTVVHLWKSDAAFKEALEHSKGLCLPHYRQLIAMGDQELGGAAEAFRQTMERLERENLARIEKELEWFTLKFDYRNAEAPWGNSRDALERAINKLRGQCL